MLQQRQLVGIISGVVEKSLHQAVCHLGAAHRHRPANGLPELVSSHARDQIQTFIDSFGQVSER